MAQGKTQTPKERFVEAESYFLYEEYNEALPIYAKLKDEFPDNYSLDYRIGRCYLNIPYESKKSVKYLEAAVKNMSGIYKKEGQWNDKKPPLDALFYLAEAYRVNNQLEKAVDTYLDFKIRASGQNYDIPYIDLHIRSCKRALEFMKSPIGLTETNVGQLVNTRFAELNPVVSRDESVMVYAAKLQFYQAVFSVRKVAGKWGTPVNIMPELGVDDDCLPTCISGDGTELYLYRSDRFKGDLYVSNYKNGQWSKVRKLNGNINTKYWESHASLSPDGKKLYFTSNRPGGYGGLDIYVSERTSGDNWGQPRNLGPVVNSKYNEDCPFITSDGKRLFFSSYGHDNMGGYDIFYSNLQTDGFWSEPVNIGYPVNTTGDDYFYCPVGSGNVGYMAKVLPNGYGRTDIVRLNISFAKPVKPTDTKTKDIASANLSSDKVQLINNNRKDSALYRNNGKSGILAENAGGSGPDANQKGYSGLPSGTIAGNEAEADARSKSDSTTTETTPKNQLANDSALAKGSSKAKSDSSLKVSKSKELRPVFAKLIRFVTTTGPLVISVGLLILFLVLFIIFKRRRRKNNENS
ncbi:MAG: tetratricopeptide repeat protein [Bacteroidota bacterium]|nr:tetratricopeptide repeat protein [Bacteroidota bacterium]